MYRRNFLKNIPAAAVIAAVSPIPANFNEKQTDPTEREYWINIAEKIMFPVLSELSNKNLKKNMPVEFKEGQNNRKEFTYLEAFGRTLAGIGPWLNLPETDDAEGKKRKQFFEMTKLCLDNASNPLSPDYMKFDSGGQPLVDSAFLAHGLLRAPRLWNDLDKQVQDNLVDALKLTRNIKPGYNNWLLFSAMIEAFFIKYGYQGDLVRIDYAIKKHLEWYKGDGMYGDGPEFHWDYYNSFVIQPMLFDILTVLKQKSEEFKVTYDLVLKRMQRYATIQERLISPEATFPPIGRSLAYRFGAFQVLGQICLNEYLPIEIKPGQVKSALSHIIKRMTDVPGTFDKNGWLTIGFSGHQKNIGESYISTGSLYLCMVGFLPLGLPANASFWTSSPEDWTSKKIWAGVDMPNDSALYS